MKNTTIAIWFLLLLAISETAIICSSNLVVADPRRQIGQAGVWDAEILATSKTSPAAVVSITHADGLVSLEGKKNTTFSATDDFLLKATIDIKNTSDKKINSLKLLIDYVSTDKETLLARIEAQAGKNTALPGVTSEMTLDSGNIFNVGLPLAEVKIFHDVTRTTRGIVRIYLTGVTFKDDPDLIWHKGYFLRRDPENPRRFVNPDAFPSIQPDIKPKGLRKINA